MIRRAALAAALALFSGVALAEQPVWLTANAPAASIAPDPWFEIGVSSVFDVDDAYVFADVSRVGALDADATAVAVRFDQERMAQSLEPVAASGGGRVGDAFVSFVAIGPEGLAYASLGLARGDAGAAVRLARANAPASPQPSLVAALLPRQ